MASMPSAPAPRVLLVMPDQWPRALLRAELRERGYDALGAPGLPAALAYPVAASGRGPVGLVLVDQQALEPPDDQLLTRLLQRHGNPPSLRLARGGQEPAAGSWSRVLRRAGSSADLADAVAALLPRPERGARPID
jgi:hypothetical protein